MNYAVYPCKQMKITQGIADGNHADHSKGSPADYPFDEACENSGRSGFYSPCDGLTVIKKYGVGKSGVNTIWLTTQAPVVTPIGNHIITIMIEHVEDSDMNKVAVGQVFKRGDFLFYEGKDGATGYHFHISVGIGKLSGSGWYCNNKKAWVLQTTDRNLKPEESFFINPAFTKIINAKGIPWKTLPA